jgi:tetratricopeptide (TPR) repeat protein
VLSGLFYFASALCLIRFYGLNSKREEIPYRWLWYGLGFVLFLCSLLSKTITFSLPAAIILLLWWKRGRVSWREAMLLLPFFALGLIFGLLTAWLERHHVGAFGLEWDLSFMDRVLIAGRALWFYAQKLIWPVELMFNYPRWQIDEGIWWQYLYPISVLVVLVVLWALRHRLGRGPFVGVSFFCGTLFPALGFIDVFPFRFSFVADHFQYLASTGLIVLAVGGTIRLWDGWLRKSRQLAIAGATLLIVTFCILTWKQCQLYRDEETLWRGTIAKNPDSFLAHNNLGGKLLSCGKLQEAITHFSEALRIDPACVKAHYNMGIALTKQGKLDAAIEHYQEALRIAPNYALAHYNLGLAYGSKGLRDLAFKEMRIAKRLSSGGQWKSIVSGTKGKKPSMPSHP